ncbi:HNH endonuclease signature motif containing protein [Nakamurella alba]|uniref:HNH endonuclease signature motif containing protein n=1 Tax=Nakamurella alba TaxID=2665158 RepID=UPI0018ABD807|nr:HNH endonuclease signature motif containing protein [Nakamurella alba]
MTELSGRDLVIRIDAGRALIALLQAQTLELMAALAVPGVAGPVEGLAKYSADPGSSPRGRATGGAESPATADGEPVPTAATASGAETTVPGEEVEPESEDVPDVAGGDHLAGKPASSTVAPDSETIVVPEGVASDSESAPDSPSGDHSADSAALPMEPGPDATTFHAGREVSSDTEELMASDGAGYDPADGATSSVESTSDTGVIDAGEELASGSEDVTTPGGTPDVGGPRDRSIGAADPDLDAQIAAAVAWAKAEEAAASQAAGEIGGVLTMSPRTARHRVHQARMLTGPLTATLHALAAGELDQARALLICDKACQLPEHLWATFEARMLVAAPGRCTSNLAALADRLVIAMDPAEASDAEHAAYARRGVSERSLPRGMARLTADVAAEDSQMIMKVLAMLADATRGMDERGINARRADALTDLFARLAAGRTVTLADLYDFPELRDVREAGATDEQVPSEEEPEGPDGDSGGHPVGEDSEGSAAAADADPAGPAGRRSEDGATRCSDDADGHSADADRAAEGDAVSGGPAIDDPVASDTEPDDSTSDGPVTEDPTVDDPAWGGSARDDSTSGGPATDDSTAVDSGPDDSGWGGSAPDDSTAGSATDDSTADDPTSEGPAPDDSAPDDPAPDDATAEKAHHRRRRFATRPPLDPWTTEPTETTMPARAVRAEHAFHGVIMVSLEVYRQLTDHARHGYSECTFAGHLSGYGAVTGELAEAMMSAATTVTMLVIDPETGAPVGVSDRTYLPRAHTRRKMQLLTQTCSWPSCRRPSERCDADHCIPYDPSDPDSGGQTCVHNLRPLCRHHHRMKTHGGWNYTEHPDRSATFTGPLGNNYLRPPPAVTHPAEWRTDDVPPPF